MGDTWIIDLSHYDGIEDPQSKAPAAARRLADYMRTITQAASFAQFKTAAIETDIRCRRRPGRQPCPGAIAVRIHEGTGAIVWRCTRCDDNGRIRNWQGSVWDLSQHSGMMQEESPPAGPFPLFLEKKELSFLLSLFQDTDWERLLRSGRAATEGVELQLSMDDLDALFDIIGQAMDCIDTRRELEILEGIQIAISMAMDGF